MKKINRPSKNFDDRPSDAKVQFLVLHSTECDLEESLRILTDDESSYPVSAHYVVAQNGDVYTLVPEEKRAWHAGKDSFWGGVNRLNATSIGIEIVNTQGNPFSEKQMKSVFELSRDIITRYRIKPNHVLAHSDIALGRKVDPGPLFDWKWLANKGVGLHPEIKIPSSGSHKESKNLQSDIEGLQDTLRHIGYKVPSSGHYDEQTRNAIKAFQMKFHPSKHDGDVDSQTIELLSKYKDIIKQTIV